jgi:hypothetical protein
MRRTAFRDLQMELALLHVRSIRVFSNARVCLPITFARTFIASFMLRKMSLNSEDGRRAATASALVRASMITLVCI